MKTLNRCLQELPKLPFYNVSRDPNVYISSGFALRRATRFLIALLLIILLFIPVVICNAQNSMTARMAVVAIAASLFIGIVSIIIKAKSIEIFMAGATYVRSVISQENPTYRV
jgi:hypothetical protein